MFGKCAAQDFERIPFDVRMAHLTLEAQRGAWDGMVFDVSDRCLSGFHVFSFVEAVFQCLSYMIYTTVYKCILYIYIHMYF